MKVGGPPATDPGRLLDQAYGGKSTQTAPEPPARSLEPGLLLKGRVVSIDGGGNFTVASERGSFTASSSRALAVGQEFWFQVAQSGTNPILTEAGKTNAVLNLLRVLLPEMLSGPGATLPSLPTDAKGPAAASQEDQRLLRFLADTAIDGKADAGKLLKTLSQLQLSRPGSDKASLADVGASASPLLREIDSPALQKLVRLLDSHAAVNQQPAATTGSDYFLFPVFFAEQSGRGEWLYSYEHNSGGAESTGVASISFYLDMTRLGDVHLAITSQPKALTGVCTLTTAEAADHVRQLLPGLTEALKPLADSVAISCRVAQSDCFKTLRKDLMAKVGMERFALIDVKA